MQCSLTDHHSLYLIALKPWTIENHIEKQETIRFSQLEQQTVKLTTKFPRNEPRFSMPPCIYLLLETILTESPGPEVTRR